MSRILLVGGTLTALTGTSAYFGMGRGWGAPVAIIGVSILSGGLGMMSLDAAGPTRWAGLTAAAAGLVLVAAIIISALVGQAPGTDGGLPVTLAFVLFTMALTVYGISGITSRVIPLAAAVALVVGAPLLAAGAWQERLGDLGFLVTAGGLVLLGATTDVSA